MNNAQMTDILSMSHALLSDGGWCKHTLEQVDENGETQHCIMGAIMASIAELEIVRDVHYWRWWLDNVAQQVADGIARQLPAGGDEARTGWSALVVFNNEQEEVGPVLDLIERTAESMNK